MFQMFVIACFGLSTRMKEIPTIFVQCVHEKRSRDIWFLLKCVKTQSTLQKELNSTEMLSRQLKTVNEFFNAHKRKDYSREFTLWTPNSMSVSLSFSRNGMIITIMKKKMFQMQHNFICNGKFKDWRVKVQTVLSITCSGVITVGNQFLCVLCFFSPVLFLFPFPPEKPWTFPVFLWYCICTSTALIPPHQLMLNRKQITFL